MKYIIISLLSGEVESYHQKLVEEISEKFGADFLAKQKAPTHFTLKDIFETEDIREVEQVLEAFAREHRAAVITLEGYNRFDDNVIFMDIELSEEARALFESFIETLKEISWMQWGPYDAEERKFHCSLAYFDIKDKYKDICRFLLSRYSYSFEAHFDNISIFQQVEDSWILYKSYSIPYMEGE